jgi:hypothetical protein
MAGVLKTIAFKRKHVEAFAGEEGVTIVENSGENGWELAQAFAEAVDKANKYLTAWRTENGGYKLWCNKKG